MTAIAQINNILLIFVEEDRLKKFMNLFRHFLNSQNLTGNGLQIPAITLFVLTN